MSPSQISRLTFVFFAAAFFCGAARAQSLDQIGVTLLREMTTNVNGAGIRVAQPEAGYDSSESYTNWEVNPGVAGFSAGLVTYISASGSTTNFPNSLSSESSHADSVAGIFYGSGGVATNVVHVDNYDANYFVNNLIQPLVPIGDPVVNQSFIGPSSYQIIYDQVYDNYAAQFKTLFVSGVGNGGGVNPPATCYNGIGVGASDGSSSFGPTPDNGRCKPDIIAPGGETSFSTPLVSGAAALLMQAGLRGDGGSDTNSAFDLRTIKALLLNGAIKPSGWTNSNSSPLDARYGAGVLNVFNSYEQLAGGKHGYNVSASITTNSVHPPVTGTNSIGVLNGWDFNTNTSSASNDRVNHYFFNLTNALQNATFAATSTLVWNRHQNKTNINNLNLFLYDAISSNLVTCSTSLVDNVQHIFVPQLPQGVYDLQVLKKGGATVSTNETYALTFEFFSEPMAVAPAGTNVALAWPVYPDGFSVESTTSLSPPINWDTNPPSPVLTNGQNYVLLNATNAVQFFRLHRP
jgi:hypothetical protein